MKTKNSLFLITFFCLIILLSGCTDKNSKIETSEIDMSSIDLSSCFEQNHQRKYETTDHIEISEKLEYTVKDDKENYLQNLLIKRYRNSDTASNDLNKQLTDSRCKNVLCEATKTKGYKTAIIKIEWDSRRESGKAPYNTQYYVLINDLLITSIGNDYNWEDSENYAKSAVECVIDKLSR